MTRKDLWHFNTAPWIRWRKGGAHIVLKFGFLKAMSSFVGNLWTGSMAEIYRLSILDHCRCTINKL